MSNRIDDTPAVQRADAQFGGRTLHDRGLDKLIDEGTYFIIAQADRTEDAMTDPICEGGQGRSGDDVEDTGNAMEPLFWIGLAWAALYAVYRAVVG